MEAERPDSILIVKLSAIGDVVHSLPFLEVLRNRFPRARIDWLVEEESSRIIDGHSGIDHVIISRRKSWQKRLFQAGEPYKVIGEIVLFLKKLRSVEYDLVVDLQGLFKSGILIGFTRGKRKIGSSGGREGSQFFLTERPYLVDYSEHAVDRYLRMAEYLDCDRDSWIGDIPVDDSNKESINRLMSDDGIPNNRLVAINPMARWRTKLWEPDKFALLADRLRKELSCGVIFTGSRDDRRKIDKIKGMMETGAVNLAGRTGLKELACLYTRTRLLISTDTGPMHMAAAMGCPVVALFGPTAPWRTGPYGQGHSVIREEMECSPCFKKRCDHMDCMKKITVHRVFESVKRLLGT